MALFGPNWLLKPLGVLDSVTKLCIAVAVVWCILQCGCDATGSLSHEAREAFLLALVSDG